MRTAAGVCPPIITEIRQATFILLLHLPQRRDLLRVGHILYPQLLH